MDLPTATLTRPSLARICVEVDLRKPLPSKLWLGIDEGFWQTLKYERLPYFCTLCNIQGHSVSKCKRQAVAQDLSSADPVIFQLPTDKHLGGSVPADQQQHVDVPAAPPPPSQQCVAGDVASHTPLHSVLQPGAPEFAADHETAAAPAGLQGVAAAPADLQLGAADPTVSAIVAPSLASQPGLSAAVAVHTPLRSLQQPGAADVVTLQGTAAAPDAATVEPDLQQGSAGHVSAAYAPCAPDSTRPPIQYLQSTLDNQKKIAESFDPDALPSDPDMAAFIVGIHDHFVAGKEGPFVPPRPLMQSLAAKYYACHQSTQDPLVVESTCDESDREPGASEPHEADEWTVARNRRPRRNKRHPDGPLGVKLRDRP